MPDANEKDASTRRAEWLIGLATYGCAVTGVIGVVNALLSVIAGRADAAAASLVAAALAFGLLVNALLRD